MGKHRWGERQVLHVAMVRSGPLQQQHHLTTLCRFLVDSGFSLDFFSLQAPFEDEIWFGQQVPGMRVHWVGKWGGRGIGRFIRGGLALRRALQETRFDILYVVDSWTLPYLFVATWGHMGFGGKPLVYHTFDLITPEGHGRAYVGLERYAARRSRLNVNTDRSRAEVAKLMFGLKERPLAVPLRLARDAVLPGWDEGRREAILGSERRGNEILAVYPTALRTDRLSKEVILAFAKLPPNYHLVTIDAGGSYAMECHEVMRNNGLQHRIHLLPPMTHQAVLELCACADIGLIFHDIDAGIGNYFCHPGRLAYYVALGLPFVAAEVPAMSALVYRYGLGGCCSPYEPAAIAEAIRELCEGSIPLTDRRRHILEVFESKLHYGYEAQALVSALERIRSGLTRA
ncbi:glycosyltransferase [Methylococcus capsulatus]|uniref:glycosyltransferase n=1 Tax=Methylococcus capsulatus TaxID=414 RepID=UPI002FDAB068